jgi:hypothetical protein
MPHLHHLVSASTTLCRIELPGSRGRWDHLPQSRASLMQRDSRPGGNFGRLGRTEPGCTLSSRWDDAALGGRGDRMSAGRGCNGVLAVRAIQGVVMTSSTTQPGWSLMIIAVDVVALYGLCAYGSRTNLEAA